MSMIRIEQEDNSRALIVGRKDMMIGDARNDRRARSADIADAAATPLTSVFTGSRRVLNYTKEANA